MSEKKQAFVNRFVDVKPFIAPSADHRELRILLSPGRDGTAPGVAVGIVTMPPGFVAPPHQHEVEQEAWYFFEGTGQIRVGDDLIDVEPGTLVTGPPQIPHQLINPGPETLKAVFIFTPAGPESALIVE
jgi:mannose-6-phosphate isomerase-like protein (cupin superfamily)